MPTPTSEEPRAPLEGSDDHDLTRSKHLQLLYPLQKGAIKDRKVDIIAVHGRDNNPKNLDAWNIWTAKDGQLWLRDHLPKHVRKARIFLYSYDSTPAFDTNREGVVLTANDLLEEMANNLLKEIRVEQKDHDPRPIIFIGNSLGSVLIKQTLINAFQFNPKIEEATTGILFFTTPDRDVRVEGNMPSYGGQIASESVGCPPRSIRIVGIFPEDNLRRVMQEFWERQVYRYSITSISGHQNDYGTRQDALHGLPGAIENSVSLNADHTQSCKFGVSTESRENLKDVQRRISNLYKTALKIDDLALYKFKKTQRERLRQMSKRFNDKLKNRNPAGSTM